MQLRQVHATIERIDAWLLPCVLAGVLIAGIWSMTMVQCRGGSSSTARNAMR